MTRTLSPATAAAAASVARSSSKLATIAGSQNSSRRPSHVGSEHSGQAARESAPRSAEGGTILSRAPSASLEQQSGGDPSGSMENAGEQPGSAADRDQQQAAAQLADPAAAAADGAAGGSGPSASEAMDAVDRGASEAEYEALTSIEVKEEQYREQQIEQKKQQVEILTADRARFTKFYCQNGRKETAVLEYVANFNRQYLQLYPGRKELILCPDNEFKIKKFVCTTIRPTQLPFKELYDFRGCAKFVSEYLAYERLDPAHELPKQLFSPTMTLKLQIGNCFDFSVLLVSLLRGVGYDAYVVSGYALREITLMDETHTDLVFEERAGTVAPKHPYSEALEKRVGGLVAHGGGHGDAAPDKSKKNDDADAKAAKYKLKPPRMLRSNFLVNQENKKKAADKAAAESLRLQEERNKAALEEDEDELKGLRIHAWVLILPGKRDVAEAFFIEPTTGKIYPTDSPEYLGVESVFSSLNYWVNMQTCDDGLKGVSFDLGDNAKWEFVFLDNSQPGLVLPRPGEPGGGMEDEEEEEDEKAASGAAAGANGGGTEVLDLPPSWVDKIAVSKEQFESRCPQGVKTLTYKNAKHEVFAEYHRADGMVSRLTFFGDSKRTVVSEIRERFENRRDKLRQRIRLPRERKIRESFDPGRPHGLKEHDLINGRTSELHFYPSARSDGLLRRVEEPRKVIEHFMHREDKITYRSVTFDTENEDDDKLDHSSIIKMTEKFERNRDIPATDDVAKRTFFLREEKIRTIYHLDEGRIIASFREFKKPTADNKNNFQDFTNSFEVNPYVKPPKKQHLYARLSYLLKAEQACLQAIKSSEREVKEILLARAAEEKDIGLVISVYDTIRNDTRIPDDADKEAHKAEEEEAKATNLDYLSPFLVNIPDSNNMSREEALQVKDACLKALKERLIEKANIIQARYEELTAAYQKRQLQYSRNSESMTVDETEEYVNYCNDVLFRIHILEKRLQKHKESAPDKYVAMDRRLRADPRLAVLSR